VQSPEFIEHLAASFLAAVPPEPPTGKENGSTPSFEKVTELRKIAFLNQAAGQPQEALRAIQSAFEQLNASQALVLRDLAFELEKNRPEEAKRPGNKSSASLRRAPGTQKNTRNFWSRLAKPITRGHS
jgi:hypothetical protein